MVDSRAYRALRGGQDWRQQGTRSSPAAGEFCGNTGAVVAVVVGLETSQAVVASPMHPRPEKG